MCPHYHGAVELIGRRWSGAILYALADDGPLRFAELKECVPGMSDRLLSTRLKELESADLVRREVERERLTPLPDKVLARCYKQMTAEEIAEDRSMGAASVKPGANDLE